MTKGETLLMTSLHATTTLPTKEPSPAASSANEEIQTQTIRLWSFLSHPQLRQSFIQITLVATKDAFSNRVQPSGLFDLIVNLIAGAVTELELMELSVVAPVR